MDISALAEMINGLGLRVRPAIPPQRLRSLEEQLGIRLPEDYAAFVTQIGDGWEKQAVRGRLWQELRPVSACEGPELLREPFPYTDAWIWEGRETDPLPGESDAAWDRRVEALMRPKRLGNLLLLRSGGECFHLILNGECRGEMWAFTDVGIAPCLPRMSFSAWLTAWLDGVRRFT